MESPSNSILIPQIPSWSRVAILDHLAFPVLSANIILLDIGVPSALIRLTSRSGSIHRDSLPSGSIKQILSRCQASKPVNVKSISLPDTGLVGLQFRTRDQVDGKNFSGSGGGMVGFIFASDFATGTGVLVGRTGLGVGVAGRAIGVGVGRGVGNITGVDL